MRAGRSVLGVSIALSVLGSCGSRAGVVPTVRADPSSPVATPPSGRAASPSAQAAWDAGRERFESALGELARRADAAASFADAEERFATCRRLDPEREAQCLGYEVMCRAGIGWSRFEASDEAAAERAFLSMNDLLERGVEWSVAGRLGSGVDGLRHLADRAFRARRDELDFAPAAEAARIHGVLRELRPGDAEIASDAGYFLREWGVPLARLSRDAAARAGREDDAARRAELEREAARLEDEARDVLERSWESYRACSELAPDDVRKLNSGALVLAYHFPSRLEEARTRLLRCVELGARQIGDPSLSDAEREWIAEGWGDAHQNLGTIALVHDRDPVAAREWFLKALEIGPRPRIERPWIRDVALPACEAVAAGRPLDVVALDPRIHLFDG